MRRNKYIISQDYEVRKNKILHAHDISGFVTQTYYFFLRRDPFLYIFLHKI